MAVVHHRFATVEGHRLFYREAGDAHAPAVILLHGFPTSSYMFRHLIPALANDYHVIAPDHLGFGLSDAPTADDFNYTFDTLTRLTAGLLQALNVDRYAMYVQDYGAPIGWRLALANPAAITAIISQNGNAYDAGFVEEFWKPIWAYHGDPCPETAAPLRDFLSLDATRWQYVTGVADETLVDPDSWAHDFALLSRPGNDAIQLALFADYETNRPLYPDVQAYFRQSNVPLLAVWGSGDPIFGPAGAQAFTADLPSAEVHLLEGGHFLLESALDKVVPLISRFLAAHAGDVG
ncbi:alpha/beta hydrolase [Mycolicibacterium cosmeticum]|uniref:Alpha/beta hydrolase fold protein n=1 Tax=Mycolicibacterium cosmeticum TaxID=258533 RepID=W9AMG7_MYCCO|nr:alpha/beta hydrolase [Mycolicibacterium cosmeticum]TLH69284.1 alpha/beta hydrolase [Mycolicibacterium cosmeticum]CDO06658.1 alpha/beta hydrolase fold protein [Mycolicibacterium cosmeticum]